MRTLLLSIAILGAACAKSAPEPAPAPVEQAAVPTIDVTELEAKLAAGNCQAVDANGDGTRKKLGVIPGAVLLTDSETYSPKSELPADKAKSLVFYCANEHCGASDEAARRARIAGYTDVRVLPAGIAGWVKAGKQTSKL